MRKARGTLINGIAKRVGDVRIGLIPLGTGNDFARCLNLPATLEENIDIVLSGGTTRSTSFEPRVIAFDISSTFPQVVSAAWSTKN
jgi:hypothetical protein